MENFCWPATTREIMSTTGESWQGESPEISWPLLLRSRSILTRLGNEPDAVRRVLKRIQDGPAKERDEALAEFSIIAGLRKLTTEVKREANRMPIQEDIMDEVWGPWLRQKQAEGRAAGQVELLLGLIEKKFGAIPPRIHKRIALLKPEQLRAASLRLLDALRIEDLFVS
jgi:hypothetical protein